jgi:predicted choloylglycine hydrolase
MRMRVQLYPEGGCSSFAVVGADGHVRVGRNYDFHTVQRVRQRLRLRPERGRPSVGTRGSVPGGRYDGVNDAGLFICLHVALADEPAEVRPGVPFHLLPRLVLETCATTQAAVDLLTRVRHLHPFNYLIADASGDLAVVEAHPEAVRVAERGSGFVAASNHYRHPDLRPYQHGRKHTHSQARLGYLYAQQAGLHGATDEGITTTLQDHASGLCGHSGGHTTLWSLTADLTARRISYAQGAPCETLFETVAWPV